MRKTQRQMDHLQNDVGLAAIQTIMHVIEMANRE